MVAYIYGQPLVIERLSWIKLKIIAWLKTHMHTQLCAQHRIQNPSKYTATCIQAKMNISILLVYSMLMSSFSAIRPSINGYSCSWYYGIRWTNIFNYLLYDSTKCPYYRIYFLNLNIQLMLFLAHDQNEIIRINAVQCMQWCATFLLLLID